MIAPASPRILAIDPGTTESGVVVFDPLCSEPVIESGVYTNDALLGWIRSGSIPSGSGMLAELTGPHILAIEVPRARGMPFSNEMIDTVIWVGRFLEAWGDRPSARVDRKDVKMFLCGVASAKDSNIRAAIIDRFGGSKALADRAKCPACDGKGTALAQRPADNCLGCGGGGRVWSAEKPKGFKCQGCKGRGVIKYRPERATCPECRGAKRVGDPGPLRGVTSHAWPALAVALFQADAARKGEAP